MMITNFIDTERIFEEMTRRDMQKDIVIRDQDRKIIECQIMIETQNKLVTLKDLEISLLR